MPSTIDTNKARANAARKLYDFNPGSTVMTPVEWMPMVHFRHFLIGVLKVVGNGAITVEIAAATDGTGAGALAVKAYLGGLLNAPGEQVWLEASADEVRSVVPAATHVTARVTLANAADRCAVLHERSFPRFPQDGLTFDIAA